MPVSFWDAHVFDGICESVSAMIVVGCHFPGDQSVGQSLPDLLRILEAFVCRLLACCSFQAQGSLMLILSIFIRLVSIFSKMLRPSEGAC